MRIIIREEFLSAGFDVRKNSRPPLSFFFFISSACFFIFCLSAFVPVFGPGRSFGCVNHQLSLKVKEKKKTGSQHHEHAAFKERRPSKELTSKIMNADVEQYFCDQQSRSSISLISH